MGNVTPNNIAKYLPKVNITGISSNYPSNTNAGDIILGSIFGLTGAVATEVLAAKEKASANAGGEVKLTPEQQAQQQQQIQLQQLYNEAIDSARSMNISEIQGKISEIEGKIKDLTISLANEQELALGKDSPQYKDNEIKIKDMEEKYGFGAGTPGKDATQEAKQGDAYQKAYDNYQTLSTKKAQQEAKAEQLTNSIQNCDDNITKTNNSINAKNNNINELRGQLTSPNLNDDQKKAIGEQIELAEIELSNLKTQLSTLQQNKINLENEKRLNEQNAISVEQLKAAKDAMDNAARPNGAAGIDYDAQYKIYKELKDSNKLLVSGASIAQTKAKGIEQEIKANEMQLAKYKDAFEIKKEIVSDDAKAMDKFDDVSATDGNWLTRTFGWGKKGRAQRKARADRNGFIKEYMANHGVSKKEAKEALENLSGMNSDNNEKVTTAPESTPSLNISLTKTHTTNFGAGVDVLDVTNEFIMKNIVTNPQINRANVNLAVIEYTTQNPNADKNDILEMLNQKFNIN